MTDCEVLCTAPDPESALDTHEPPQPHRRSFRDRQWQWVEWGWGVLETSWREMMAQCFPGSPDSEPH